MHCQHEDNAVVLDPRGIHTDRSYDGQCKLIPEQCGADLMCMQTAKHLHCMRVGTAEMDPKRAGAPDCACLCLIRSTVYACGMPTERKPNERFV
jgi:hypothetical protein